ncbi:MAG: hypothetical protein ACLFTV_14315 [Desulfococcaceae bacterium]
MKLTAADHRRTYSRPAIRFFPAEPSCSGKPGVEIEKSKKNQDETQPGNIISPVAKGQPKPFQPGKSNLPPLPSREIPMENDAWRF